MQPPSSVSRDVFSALTAGLHFNSKVSRNQASSQQAPSAGHKRKRDAALEADPAAVEDTDGSTKLLEPDAAAAVLSNDPFEAANILRKRHGIRVSGGQAPPPLANFAELGTTYNCSKRLLAKLEEHKWHEPTAIQRQAMPALLQGHELFAIAPTGSGKTLAFLLPIIAKLYQQKQQQQKPPDLPNHADITEPQKHNHNKISTAKDPAEQAALASEITTAGMTTAGIKSANSKRQKVKASEGIIAPLKGSSQSAKAAAPPKASSQSAASLVPLKGSAELSKGNASVAKGPGAVVLAPSRELAAQTARCLLLLLKGLKLRCTLLTAAVAAGTDFTKMDLVVATPKRLAHLVKSKQIDLSSVRFLILDEADKLFEGGFVSHIDAIIHACTHPDVIDKTLCIWALRTWHPLRDKAFSDMNHKPFTFEAALSQVRALFSATLPQGVEDLASSVLQSPLRLTVGPRNAPTSTVAQRLLFVGQQEGKMLGLRQLIAEGLTPPVLLFVSSKERAEIVHRQIMFDGVHAGLIHSSQPQSVRNAAVDSFRSGATWLLVATDLVGRGMDFLGVQTVINYDFPQSTTDYIHRVGRTGRAGRSGEAITFYTEDDAWQLRSIINVMRAAGCEVPDWMLQLKKERRKSHEKKGKRKANKNSDKQPSASKQIKPKRQQKQLKRL